MPVDIRDLCPLIQVFDMPTAIRFYRDQLGFTLTATSEHDDARSESSDNVDWALLTLNEANLMLNTAYEWDSRPPAPDRAIIKAHGDTALYFGCPDPDAAYEALLAAGLKLNKPSTAPYGMRQVYMKDPDGYTICFQCPAKP